ncbi:hypothetical protein FNF27_07788 [Cafeteria roenbergensis]|uniref:ABM domain-containing protein n=1 Tax=Cafeteria roenbergensis TaxID=33653 RepID=A0A5A8C0T3_CAFRO|nr:hypothetical protein FNF29_08019 [Cafeteria roenbergensis]KAA0150497.1 hypothetical protein FNF31_07017 [Cafeteria roenbergensis]KAA0161636.1 hypothetical protein FNF28_04985 [Cafeteria roenbergensis]KAA0164533.1 hypothetical protein FNF27_07788 [Cafeteria roenbergensis]|eukprot:KAA0146488.1 hypothetical protein FNF29_08019 [Cafeteria roenbergensis]
MAVAVVTERMVLAGKERSLMRLLKQLQSKAALHPGYITSRAYRDEKDERRIMVLSEWAHQSAWESWEGRSADRKAISGEIADCLFGPTNHRVYSCVAAEQGDDFRL